MIKTENIFTEKLMKYSILFFTLILSLTLFISCSDLKEDITTSAPKLSIHDDGIVNPTSPNFHGNIVRSANWDMKQCQQCHSANYSGGTAGTSCYNSGCHNTPGGPEACNTCHGDFVNPLLVSPPRALSGAILPSERGVGAHTKHLSGNQMGKAVECTECHTIPNGFSDPIHIDQTPGAELVFGSFTRMATNIPGGFNYQPSLGNFNPNPTFDTNSGSCSNTYCHGYFKNGNLNNVVLFTAQTTGAACGTCHGDPATGNPLPKTVAEGGTHPPNQNCATCHTGIVEVNGNTYTILDKNKHMNGKLNIFGNEETY
jgi:predicted CxxxxCH...CXXCH cytochrome family protein